MKKIVVILGALLLAGVVWWSYLQKNMPAENQPNVPMAGHQKSIAEFVKEIMGMQHVAAPANIDCAKVDGDQFKELGDSVMEKLAGNETQHSKMEEMTGGEDSPATVAVHKAMGENYLGCNDSAQSHKDIIVMLRLDAQKGDYITDPKRMTLYTFDSDKLGVSNCKDKCIETWPPYLVPNGTKGVNTIAGLGIMRRENNMLQFTFKGMPLYSYSQDKKAGDMLGDNVKNLWHIVKP